MIDETGENIVKLPVVKREAPKPELTIVCPFSGCQHRAILVDERAAEVTCRDCKEKLNPIWALAMLCREDSNLIRRWAMLSAHSRLIEGRTKVKCRHCDKMTSIPMAVSDFKVRDLAEQIRKEAGL